jgi:hypothetical protein
MDYLLVSLLVILGNVASDIFFVLVLNPRRSANRIKSEIIQDKKFRVDFIELLTDEEIIHLYDPLLDRLNLKIRGMQIQPLGQEAIAEKQIGAAILEDVKEKSPEMELLVEGLRIASPNLYKLAKRRPDLIPAILDRARRMGFIPDHKDNMEGFDPYA